MAIELVAFDLGEVLVDETRMWGEWADWLGVSRLTFFAVLGAVIAEGRHHGEVFARVRPGFDLAAARRVRQAQSWSILEQDDLYPDAAPCLQRLRAGGYRVAIAANQPRRMMAALRCHGIEADLVACSEEWGVEKPAPEFFQRLIAAADLPAARIAYVGDRIDNDVLPAKRAGLVGVFLRRGPWGVLHQSSAGAAQADLRIDSLDALPEALNRLPPQADAAGPSGS
jgi:HAD superfamily hydrolase (TIGR01549 family)